MNKIRFIIGLPIRFVCALVGIFCLLSYLATCFAVVIFLCLCSLFYILLNPKISFNNEWFELQFKDCKHDIVKVFKLIWKTIKWIVWR